MAAVACGSDRASTELRPLLDCLADKMAGCNCVTIFQHRTAYNALVKYVRNPRYIEPISAPVDLRFMVSPILRANDDLDEA